MTNSCLRWNAYRRPLLKQSVPENALLGVANRLRYSPGKASPTPSPQRLRVHDRQVVAAKSMRTACIVVTVNRDDMYRTLKESVHFRFCTFSTTSVQRRVRFITCAQNPYYNNARPRQELAGIGHHWQRTNRLPNGAGRARTFHLRPPFTASHTEPVHAVPPRKRGPCYNEDGNAHANLAHPGDATS